MAVVAGEVVLEGEGPRRWDGRGGGGVGGGGAGGGGGGGAGEAAEAAAGEGEAAAAVAAAVAEGEVVAEKEEGMVENRLQRHSPWPLVAVHQQDTWSVQPCAAYAIPRVGRVCGSTMGTRIFPGLSGAVSGGTRV